MTIRKLKELISDLPDDAIVAFHAWDKGFALHPYDAKKTWTFPKDAPQNKIKTFVLNPDSTYDER